MISLIERTLFKYINSNIKEKKNSSDDSNVIQVKIPVKEYRFGIIFNILKYIEDSYALDDNVDVEIKIAKPAYEYLQTIDTYSFDVSYVKQNYNSWIDTKGNLTAYRNDVAVKSQMDKSKFYLLILVGYDCIDDQASLEHLLDCSCNSLFSNAMNEKFNLWLDYMAQSPDDWNSKDKTVALEVLDNVYRYTDLQHLDDYLIGLDFNATADCITSRLDELNLCYIYNPKKVTRVSELFTGLHKFFTGGYSGDAATLKLKTVSNLLAEVEADPTLSTLKTKFLDDPDKHLYPTYNSAEDYLLAVRDVLEKGTESEEISKLRKCDGDLLIKKVLKFKITKEKSKNDTTVYGMPLEAVLEGVFDCFKYFCTKNYEGESFQMIEIKPVRLVHNYSKEDFGNQDDGTDDNTFVYENLIIPNFGGLDKILTESIKERLEINEYFEECTIVSSLGDRATYSKGVVSGNPNKIPYFIFSVTIYGLDGNKLTQKYKWFLRPGAPTTYSHLLMKSILHKLHKNAYPKGCLPVFSVGKYEELFEKPDDEYEEFFESKILSNRKLNDPCNICDDIVLGDGLDEDVYNLYQDYLCYLKEYVDCGLYYAITHSSARNFQNKYNLLLEKVISKPEFKSQYTTFVRGLAKAFWVLSKKDTDTRKLAEQKFESGVVTVTHPAMIELLFTQMNYLCDSFAENLTHLIEVRAGKIIWVNTWNRIVDFSKLQSPIPCVLGANGNLNTQVKGCNLMYLLGKPNKDEVSGLVMSTSCRVTDDDDYSLISDKDFNKESEESALIFRLLRDYFNSNSNAYDGIKIAVFLPENIQPLLCALGKLVKSFVNSNDLDHKHNHYKLTVILYVDVLSEGRIISWVNRYADYFNEKKFSDACYANTDLMIGNRVVDCSNQNYRTMTQSIEADFDADVSIVYESRNTGRLETSFMKIKRMDAMDQTVKFPMIEKISPKTVINQSGCNSLSRNKVISNRQFAINTSYMRYLYSYDHELENEADAIISETVALDSWIELVRWCLTNSERVIAIGSEVDKELIAGNDDDTTVVGFGSGIGSTANLNYAVATKLYDKSHIMNKLQAQFNRVYVELDDTDKIVANLYRDSKSLADLSLVRTFSTTGYYTHDYFGYSMIRHILKPDKPEFCDVMLSLDSYKHWFGLDVADKMRADILWLCADVVQVKGRNVFNIKASIIESKMGINVVDNHLDKAALQLNKTIYELSNHFNPSSCGTDYDSRYWWMQLYRIIAANTELAEGLNVEERKEAFENLAEGIFTIEWDAFVMAFELSRLDNRIKPQLLSVSVPSGERYKAYVFNDLSVEHYVSTDMTMGWKALRADFENNNTFEEYEAAESRAKSQDNKEREQRRLILENRSIDALEDKESDDDDEDSYNPLDTKETHDPEPEYTVAPDDKGANVNVDNFDENDIDHDEFEENQGMDKTEHASDVDIEDMKILLGKTVLGEEPVYWYYGNKYKLANRHILVLGSSGFGKSYAIQAILGELARCAQPSLIVDYTDGFTSDLIEPPIKHLVKDYIIRRTQLDMNPFIAQKITMTDMEGVEDVFDESSYDVASRVTSVFSREYQGLGEIQLDLLSRAIEESVDIYGNDLDMKKLLKVLEAKSEEKGVSSKQYTGLVARLKPLCMVNPFKSKDCDPDAWMKYFDESVGGKMIKIFQLAHISKEAQKAIIEFILWDLWSYMDPSKSNKNTPHMIVLDEIQNLDMSEESPVMMYMKEGRKHGLNLIAATQSIAGLGGTTAFGTDGLMNAGTKLFFKPTDTEFGVIGKILAKLDQTRTEKEWANKLAKLQKGQCYVSTVDENGKPVMKLIHITSLEDRGITCES